MAYEIARKQSGLKVTAVRQVCDNATERWWQWGRKDGADKKKTKAKRIRGGCGEPRRAAGQKTSAVPPGPASLARKGRKGRAGQVGWRAAELTDAGPTIRPSPRIPTGQERQGPGSAAQSGSRPAGRRGPARLQSRRPKRVAHKTGMMPPASRGGRGDRGRRARRHLGAGAF